MGGGRTIWKEPTPLQAAKLNTFCIWPTLFPILPSHEGSTYCILLVVTFHVQHLVSQSLAN